MLTSGVVIGDFFDIAVGTKKIRIFKAFKGYSLLLMLISIGKKRRRLENVVFRFVALTPFGA